MSDRKRETQTDDGEGNLNMQKEREIEIVWWVCPKTLSGKNEDEEMCKALKV